MELELKSSRRLKLQEGIGLGIESNQYFLEWNWNQNCNEHRWPGFGIELESTFVRIAQLKFNCVILKQ